MAVSIDSSTFDEITPDGFNSKIKELRVFTKVELIAKIVGIRGRISEIKKNKIHIDKIVEELERKDKAMLEIELFTITEILNELAANQNIEEPQNDTKQELETVFGNKNAEILNTIGKKETANQENQEARKPRGRPRKV